MKAPHNERRSSLPTVWMAARVLITCCRTSCLSRTSARSSFSDSHWSRGLPVGGCVCECVCVQRGRGEKIEGTLTFYTYTIKFVIPKVQTDYKNHYLLKMKILHSFGRVNTSLVCSKSRLHSHSFALTSLDTFRSHGCVMQCLYL